MAGVVLFNDEMTPTVSEMEDNQFGRSLTYETQIIYKLGALESSVTSMVKRIDEKMDKLQSDLNDRYKESTVDLARLEVRIDVVKDDIAKLKEWRTVIVTRLSAAFFGMAAFWALFGHSIQEKLASLF